MKEKKNSKEIQYWLEMECFLCKSVLEQSVDQDISLEDQRKLIAKQLF